jgi:ubiquinone/menaquinone biosynthesis C-methylase UbiE
METTGIVERSDARSGQEGSDTDELRERLRGMWAAVAGAWEEHADFVDARGVSVTEKMLELTQPQPGERVLELACGPGSVGLAAAARVAPGGEVVMSDVVAEMTAIASARAEALGLNNISTRVLDLERIEEPESAYDVVLCREGLMLVPDPALASREIRRVVRPGGRIALAVWGSRARNPWLGIVFDTVSAQLGAPMPPPGIPHPFSLGDPDKLAGLLSDAGLSEVAVDELPTPYHAASFEEWWERSASLAGPLAQKLASLPAAAALALRARAREAISAYITPTGLEFPGVSLLAAARRT